MRGKSWRSFKRQSRGDRLLKWAWLYAAGAGGMDLLVSDGTAVLFRGKAVRESLAESNRDHNTGAGLDS